MDVYGSILLIAYVSAVIFDPFAPGGGGSWGFAASTYSIHRLRFEKTENLADKKVASFHGPVFVCAQTSVLAEN